MRWFLLWSMSYPQSFTAAVFQSSSRDQSLAQLQVDAICLRECVVSLRFFMTRLHCQTVLSPPKLLARNHGSDSHTAYWLLLLCILLRNTAEGACFACIVSHTVEWALQDLMLAYSWTSSTSIRLCASFQSHRPALWQRRVCLGLGQDRIGGNSPGFRSVCLEFIPLWLVLDARSCFLRNSSYPSSFRRTILAVWSVFQTWEVYPSVHVSQRPFSHFLQPWLATILQIHPKWLRMTLVCRSRHL